MAMAVKNFVATYLYYVDPRTEDWFLIHPIKVIALLSAYLYFVLKWGPKFMENRLPFKLDRLILFYNAFQIFASAYFVVVGFPHIFFEYNWRCQPVDKDTAHGLYVAGLVWMYYMIKVIDLLDTVFFVLRKKTNQISFLHVYHHAGMVALAWGGVKFLPGGQSVYIGYINSIVHFFMYFYYLLTVWDPSWKENVWLKRRITEMQLVQFFILIICYTQLLFQDCGYPKLASLYIVPQNFFMLFLFGDFYIKTYLRAGGKRLKVEKGES